MDETMDMEVRFRTRKFILATGMFSVATLLLLTGNITDIIWQNVTMFIGGGYFLANVSQKKLMK